MIDRDIAKRIAYEFIRGDGTNTDLAHVIVIEKATREESFGWVFFWNDKRYVDTGNMRYALLGNQPVVVLRKNGRALLLPYPPSAAEANGDAAFHAMFDIDARIRDFATRVNEQ